MKKPERTSLSESIIRAGATPESFKRGQQLYHDGAISNAALQGTVLRAHCEGTMAPYYRVTAELDDAGIHRATCTCPYDYGGYCKHLVALLLTYLHKPKTFVKRKTPSALLADLNREELLALVARLVEHNPELYDSLEVQLAAPITPRTAKARKTKINADVYRRQIIGIIHSLDGMRSSEAYWHLSGLVNQLRGIQTRALQFLDHGDAASAVTILLVLAEEAIEGWGHIDDSDGDYGNFLAELDQPLAEAILSGEWTATERARLRQRIEQLNEAVDRIIGECMFYAALDALEHGWENRSKRTRRGGRSARRAAREIEQEDWDEDEEGYDEAAEYDESAMYPHADLVQAKLNVLERQGKTDEYLTLAKKEKRYLCYARKLCELGRVLEGTNYGLDHFTTTEEALQLARQLRDAKQIDFALAVGERGLKLGGPKAALGKWLAPLEEAQGRTPDALQAWRAAFEENPSLDIYKRLKESSAANWQHLQPHLMSILQKEFNTRPLVEVLLYEERWDDAIQAAEGRHVYYEVVALVADAVATIRPEWVVHASQKQAAGLIARKESKYYAAAAEWLKRAKRAYTQLGQHAEWRAYLDHLKQEYSRRPALQAQLQRL